MTSAIDLESSSISALEEQPSSYEQVIGHLSQKDRQAIEKLLSTLKSVDLERFVHLINNQKWTDFFADQSHAFIALEALRRALITPQQFGTVLSFWIASKFEEAAIQIVPLFALDQKVNEKALKCIQESILVSRKASTVLPSRYLKPLLTPEQLDQFYEKMRSLPGSEQSFAIINSNTVYPNTLSLITQLGLNAFWFCREGRMVPSFGMMQTFIEVKYGDQSPKLAPTLGPLTTPHELSLTFPPLENAIYVPTDLFTRLYFSHAILQTATAQGETEEAVLRQLLTEVSVHPQVRYELHEALKLYPDHPLLQLLSRVLEEPT